VFNRARVELGDTVVVIGAGGVGLNVIQAARLCGASQIIAIDRIASKERMAVEFGATDFILAEGDDFDSIKAVNETSTCGVDHAFEVVGSTKLLADAISMVRPGGNICAVGVPDLTATVTYPFQALHQNKNLLGIRAGGGKPRSDFPLLADLYLKGNFKLDELVSHTAGLDGLQGAFDALRSGAEARTVLLPHG
jgi:S-(hydroxymethyl)glutathione dehydrogenase/alcohol dehydrogenase